MVSKAKTPLILEIGGTYLTKTGEAIILNVSGDKGLGYIRNGNVYFWTRLGKAVDALTKAAFGDITGLVKAAESVVEVPVAPKAARPLPSTDIDGILKAITGACGTAERYRAKGFKLIHQLMGDKERITMMDVLEMKSVPSGDMAWIGTRAALIPAGIGFSSIDQIKKDLAAWQLAPARTMKVQVGHYYANKRGDVFHVTDLRDRATVMFCNDGRMGIGSKWAFTEDGLNPSVASAPEDPSHFSEDLGTTWKIAAAVGQIWRLTTGLVLLIANGRNLILEGPKAMTQGDYDHAQVRANGTYVGMFDFTRLSIK